MIGLNLDPIFCRGLQKTANPVTSLKVGDEVALRVQGGARHTGIEIQEFIVEN
jgi:3-dehydroquinate synthase class II